ncbi:MAG: alpha/beta fold hydrolase, partial [Pirellulaceae bacterium]
MLSPKILMVLPLLFLGLLIGCGQAQPPEQQSVPSEQHPTQLAPEPETAEPESEVTEDVHPEWIPESAARALLALIIAGQYDQVAENFNDEVAAALPGEKLKTNVETLQKQVGRYQGVADEAKVQEIQSNQVVDLLCSFEITKLVFRVSYNEQQQVAGIFFLPAPAEPTPVDKNAPPDVQLQTKDTTLYGTIELPAGDGPFPVVLIVSGSGPNDRDGNQAALKSDYLKKLAAGLTEQGFAVLRYDKRGSGKSEVGDAPLETFRFDVFVDDAVGWVAMLRKDQRFSGVAILGHSQGSLVAMLAAQQV